MTAHKTNNQTPKNTEGWALWFVGLPGSGKSTIARCVFEALHPQEPRLVLLQMDAWRKLHLPDSGYTREERESAYRAFAQMAAERVHAGDRLLLDGTAYRQTMRRYARDKIVRFAEIYVTCPLEIAMQRESSRPQGLVMAEMYRKALWRKQTGQTVPDLGEVIGVDIEFEIDPCAECVLDSSQLSPQQACDRIVAWLEQSGWLSDAVENVRQSVQKGFI
ncbi:adenylyl-sulfate kinase [Myxococcota bacterium]|nr:adenylyl-sulfate kinase [Myxococcota bacterium]